MGIPAAAGHNQQQQQQRREYGGFAKRFDSRFVPAFMAARSAILGH